MASKYKASDGSVFTPSQKEVQVCVLNKKAPELVRKMGKSTKKSVVFSVEDEDEDESESESSRDSEDDSEFEDEEDDDIPYRRTKRKYPARSSTINHKPNYSEKQYYERFSNAFNDRIKETPEKHVSEKVLSSGSSSPRRRRIPKRKSSEKNIDYSVKRYYERFESAMKTKISSRNLSDPPPKRRKESEGKGEVESVTVNDSENANEHLMNETEDQSESDDSVEDISYRRRSLRNKQTAR